MAKRSKKLEKGAESLKREIEEHFQKVEDDIEDGEINLGRYHIKEIERSLLFTLERKINLIGAGEEDSELIKTYKKRLEEFKKKLGVE